MKQPFEDYYAEVSEQAERLTQAEEYGSHKECSGNPFPIRSGVTPYPSAG